MTPFPERGSIYVLSDATAETAERVLRAALIQFREARPDVRIFSLLRKDEQIEDAVRQAAVANALVIYTIVNHEQRELLEARAQVFQLQTVDLIGTLMRSLSGYLGTTPAGRPGLPSGDASQVISLSSQISSDPRLRSEAV